MSNVWRVFRRDVGRILHVRKAWIIVIGVIVVPSLYAWFNIVGFWDPYGNTGNIHVSVVNQDRGASSDIAGDLHAGDEVVDQLRDNDQLGWQFVDYEQAMDDVHSGASYAAIVIPEDFSADLLSITSGTFTQPQLRYYVNEKANAIAPKVTDTGASKIETQITSSFVSTVAQVVTDKVAGASGDLEHQLDGARDTSLDSLDNAMNTIGSANESLNGLRNGLEESRPRLTAAANALDDVDGALADAQKAIEQSQGIVAQAQGQVVTFTDSATAAYVQSATVLAEASAKADSAATDLNQSISEAKGKTNAAITDLKAAIKGLAAGVDRLKQIANDSSLTPEQKSEVDQAISSLQDRNIADEQVLQSLQQLSGDTSASDSVAAASHAIDAAIQGSQDTATQMRGILVDTLPSVNSSLSALSGSSSALSAALDGQRIQLAQAKGLLGQVDGQIEQSVTILDGLTTQLSTLGTSLDTVRTDVVALGAASSWGNLGTLTGLNAQQIAEFMASPVQVNEQVLFPVSSYGSAMAALFTNLTLWIGAFMLMVMFKLEVDREGIEGITVKQAYLGRWLLLAVVAALQAVLVCSGNLVIGVQTVNALAFVLTGVVVGAAYLSIIYALSVSFGHVGKGLCLILVFMQIPGASGMYPIEMMPGFFRAIYPFLPFTYGINAMRETISGFYGNHYWQQLGVLAIFVVLSFVLGLAVRQRMGNLNRLFNRQIASTDLFIAEQVQITGGPYRLSQVIHALSNRDEYREELAHRGRWFTHFYSRLRWIGLIGGLAGLLVIAVIASILPGGKASLLGIWVAWVLLVIIFMVTVEYVRFSFGLANDIGQMEESELRSVVLNAQDGTAQDGTERLDAQDGTEDGVKAVGQDGRSAAPQAGEHEEREADR